MSAANKSGNDMLQCEASSPIRGASKARRVVVVAAASVAVVIGGVVGCSAEDGDPARTSATGDEPAVPDTPTAAATKEPGSGSSDEVPRSEPEPADASAPDQLARDGASEGAEAQAPETDGSEDEVATSATTAPEQFSTGPVLQWTEIDPGFDDLFMLESAGDGRVTARAWADGDGQGLFGERVVVSANGTDWTEVPLPEGLFPDQVNISSGRWVVTGRYPDVDPHDIGVHRVFFSDDQGATWTETVIELPSDSASPYAAELWRASSVLVAVERMVLVLSGYSTINGQALLEDLGHLPDGKRVVFTLPTPDGVEFTLVDADAPNDLSSLPFTFTASALASMYGHFDEVEEPELSYDELELSYDEVGFTEDEMFDLFAPRDGPLNHAFSSDGPIAELVNSFDGLSVSGAVIDEGFVLTVITGTTGMEETVLTSSDGLAWSEAPSFGPGYFGGTVSNDGTIWWVVFQSEGSFEVRQARLGERPETVATFRGLQYPRVPLLGPAGLVIIATASPGGSPRIDDGLPEGRVAKDGYELRYEADGGLTLWDLNEDTAVYVFGPEDMRSSTPPDGVRLIDEGQSSAIVFEDPETGADLVTFTTEDLASLVGMTAAELEAASSGDPELPEQWVGWSADGSAWGWASLADAFGIDHGGIWAEFAVGRDFVIARVATFQPLDPADSTGETSVSQDSQDLPTRWFIAKVP